MLRWNVRPSRHIHQRLGPEIAVLFKDMILSSDGSTEWSGDLGQELWDSKSRR